MSKRRCLRCHAVYEGGARFCPQDGSPLVEVTGTPKRGRAPAESEETVVRRAVSRSKGPSPRFSDGTLSAQVVDSRYEVKKRLGEGGMAFVYEAVDVATGDHVAVKVLSPKLAQDATAVERLRREAGLAMRLDHPHACKIMRFGETEDGLLYLVMPYLAGELLSDRENKVGPMAADQAVEILVQVCSGLHHAHGLHIIHRDLKPENVMLIRDADGKDSAVVMDFGLAKDNRLPGGAHKLTATGVVLGTPEFMSPEQVRGKELDPRSDVYAVGVMAFEMFTGELPFSGRTPQEMMVSRLRGQPASLRRYRQDLPPQLDRVLLKAMQTEPKDRYATALELGEALVQSLEGPQGGFLARLKSTLS